MESDRLTLQDIADKEKVSRSLVSQKIALAYLPADILEAILDGRQRGSLQLENSRGGLPLDWQCNGRALQFASAFMERT